MKTISIKINKDHKYELQGNFEFTLDNKTVIRDGEPVKEIKFLWSPEIQQDRDVAEDYEQLYEKIGEKLKEDFISFLNNKN